MESFAKQPGRKSMSSGGFMNPDESTSSPATTSKRGNFSQQNLMPCTAAILLNSEFNIHNQTFTYKGTSMLNVVIVGRITTVEEAPNAFVYKLNDGTSFRDVAVRKWVDDVQNDTSKLPFCREDCFVRVIGHLQASPDPVSCQIIALAILPVVDLNELTYHALDVIHSHLIASKTHAPFSGNNRSRNSSLLDCHETPPPRFAGSTHQQQSRYASHRGDDCMLDEVANQIYEVITKHPKSRTGVKPSELKAHFPNLTEQEIKNKCECLFSEGHIYTTTDDDTYASSKSAGDS